jgi:hypothetical protein
MTGSELAFISLYWKRSSSFVKYPNGSPKDTSPMTSRAKNCVFSARSRGRDSLVVERYFRSMREIKLRS